MKTNEQTEALERIETRVSPADRARIGRERPRLLSTQVGLISEALSDHYDLMPFESERAELDPLLKQGARRAHQSGTSRVTVWTDDASGIVVGFYAIAPTNVAPDGLSRKARAGLTGAILGYLPAKLALSRFLMGKGLGGQLLLEALETVAAAANVGGGRLVARIDAVSSSVAGPTRRSQR